MNIFDIACEHAALEAARKLCMLGMELNKHGAIDLCHGFIVELNKLGIKLTVIQEERKP